jgi:hypothetical protein
VKLTSARVGNYLLGHSKRTGKALGALAMLSCAVLSIATLLFQTHFHLMPLAWETQALQSISPEQGHAFIAPLPTPRWSSHNAPSPAQVLEDGKQLGPGNAPHEEIRSEGEGRYSYWHDSSGNGRLYFASSDNSDPRTNGRGYETRTPLVVGSRVQWPLYGLTVLSWMLVLSLARSRRVLATLARHAIRLTQLAALLAPRGVHLTNLLAMRAARMASRVISSLWLSGIVIIAGLLFCLYGEPSLSAVSGVDPSTWGDLLPAFAHAIGTAVRDGHTSTVIAVILVLLPAYRATGMFGTIISLGMTVALFLLPLLALWSTGYTNPLVIGGLLPWSDANGYYWDANRLLEGTSFSYFSSRRPMFAGLLATTLGLTQRNLQVTLIVIALIVGIACFLAAREVAASHGAAAGVALVVVLFLFSREYAGEAMTESLGISLGAIAFALLWRGVRQQHVTIIWLGIFFLGLALNARAGALLVLPALVLWGAWYFRGGAPVSIRFFAGGTVAILLAFLLNLSLLRLVGAPDGVAFANYSQVLYGLVSGGKGWTQALVDHPELADLGEPQFSQEIYRVAVEAFRANPSGLLVGSLRAWGDFFDPRAWGVFSFVYVWLLSPEALNTRIVLYALSGVGVLVLLIRRRDQTHSMMLAAVLGVLASVPLVPPVDSDQMRTYAATVPIVGAMAALGLHGVLSKMRASPLAVTSESSRFPGVVVVFGVGLAVLCLLGPIVTRAVSRPTGAGQFVCQPGEESLQVRITPGSSFQLVSDASLPQSFLPRIRVSDFKKQLTQGSVLALYPELFDELETVSPGKTVLLGLNLSDPLRLAPGEYGTVRPGEYGWPIWIIVDTDAVPATPQAIGVCAKPAATNWLRGHRFYNSDSIASVEPAR